MISRSVIVVLVFLCSACPAIAQDGSEIGNARTPDNARRFLSALPDQTFITASSRGRLSLISYHVARFVHNDDCNAVIDGLPRLYGFGDFGVQGPQGSARDMNVGDANLLNGMDPYIRQYGLTKAPYNVNWAVSTVVQNPFNDVTQTYQGEGRLRLITPNYSFELAFLTKELASRARLAMETLRSSCDKTAGTGF